MQRGYVVRVAVSHDGRHVYVLSARFHGRSLVAVFERDARSGALRQPPGGAGCVAFDEGNGCSVEPALRFPRRGRAISLSISPDDATVLVAGEGQIAVLARDRITGTLRAPSSGARCFSAAAVAGCEGLLGIPDDVRDEVHTAFAPDGRAVYITYPGFTTDFDERWTEVFTLFRDERGGLHAPPQPPECGDPAPCLDTQFGLPESSPLLVAAPDAAYILGVSSHRTAVHALDRDPTTGVLARATGPGTCFGIGCGQRARLPGYAAPPMLSRDGRQLYVASGNFRSKASYVEAFRRISPAPRLSRLTACPPRLDCGVLRAAVSPDELAGSVDGRRLYVYSSTSRSVAVLARRANGVVSQFAGSAGCAGPRSLSCAPAWIPRISYPPYIAQDAPPTVAVSPNDRYVYVLADGVALLQRR